MQRLKTHSQFRAVLAGPRISSSAHFVLHQCDLKKIGLQTLHPIAHDGGTRTTEAASSLHESVMGAMVPKRWVKRAVTRNMIKRQIYNVGDLAASALPPAAYVVRLRAGFDRRLFVSASSIVLKRVVRQELMALFSVARRLGNGSGCVSARQP